MRIKFVMIYGFNKEVKWRIIVLELLFFLMMNIFDLYNNEKR